MLKIILNVLWVGLFVLLGVVGNAQTLTAKVSLRADRLLPEDQNILNEIPQKLTDYLNNHRWGDNDQEIIVRCDLNFVIEAMSEGNGLKNYQGQLLVSSQSGENFLDKGIRFPYQIGQQMEHQRSSYDALLTIVDYYVFMILGGEMDTYILRGGTPFYDRARNMVSEGQVSNYSAGWGNRQEQVEIIRNSDHESLRDAKFYYYEGLFYIEHRENREKGPEYSQKVVQLIDNVFRRRPNSTALKRFLDAHYQEFCVLFSYDTDRSNINKMAQIDNRHRESYQECKIARGPLGTEF